MIIVKTPFRVSFAGGGSDLSAFYSRGHGAVVSSTIDKFMYIMIHPYFHDKIRIKYSRTEDVSTVNKIRHPLVRECLALMKIERGIEIASIADVPAGTGLGSSSAFTVGLLNALSKHSNVSRSPAWLAKTACEIEIEKVGDPIGKQDQYAVAFGGMNYICFNADGSVCVEPIRMKPDARKRLQENTLLFYVGRERRASVILEGQTKRMTDRNTYNKVCRMVNLAKKMKDVLQEGVLEQFGTLLHEGWMLKRELAKGITDPALDDVYSRALEAGATGGKLLGAGGGGFFLFYCPGKYRSRLRRALKLRELRFRFCEEGSMVVFCDREGGCRG